MKNYSIFKHSFCTLSLFIVMLLHAGVTYAQEKLRISFSNVSLEEALKKIESASKYTFFYDDKRTDLSQKVSANANGQSIEEVLNAMLKTTNLTYEIDNRQIALIIKEKNGISQKSKKISGVVKDENNEPVIGVSIVQRNTTNGTITDLDGKYVLEVEPNAILVISYIGYVTQQTPASGNVMNITLKEDTQNLDEVVVVGYGTQQKKDITGSVAVIDTEELLASSGSSATQQLQGKAAGVNIGTSGAPGSATMVRIRGINSINDNGPLYVIDGVSTRDQDLSSINPNDIESMQVLKDASSAAIYGAQAANGVILITTKKGTKTGQPRLTYDGYYGFSKTGKRYDVLNAYDRIDVEWQASKNNLDLTGASANGELPYHQQFGSTSDSWVNHLPNYMTVTGAGGSTSIDPSDYDQANNVVYAPVGDTNWWDEISQLGWMQNHQLSLSGGTDKGQYTMSMNYFDQQGTAIESYFTRYQARANSSYNVRPWLRFGENLTYSFSKNNGLSFSGTESNIYSWTYRASPYVPVYDYAGNYAGSLFAGTGNFQNPVAIRERNKDNSPLANVCKIRENKNKENPCNY